MTSLVSDAMKEALPELFVEGNVVATDQAFKRKLAEYELNLEQQKLYREDLRDLVELTVGRMDVYNMVGALLLVLCMSFFTENPMVEPDSPIQPWVLTLFFISNLGAAGYLILAVWLSMHASVSAHSIGVRLLTRFARLAVPTREELQEVAKAPLMPIMDRFLQLGRRFGLTEPTQHTTAAGIASGAAASTAPAGLAAIAEGRERATTAFDQGQNALLDRELHFRRFTREQRRWLCYDAYARVSMSLGMNQLLLALSYWIVGAISRKSPVASTIVLIGLQCLSCLLLRLDVTPEFQKKRDVAAAVCFLTFPPIYVNTLIWILPHLPSNSGLVVAYLATLAHLAHSGWLIFVGVHLNVSSESDLDTPPRQLRTVLYLDVLHLEQERVTNEALVHTACDDTSELRANLEQLRERMRIILEEEVMAGAVSTSRRSADDLQELQVQIQEQIQELRTQCSTAPKKAKRAMRAEARRADKVLDHFAVWQRAPEIHANLAALNTRKVQGWLTEDEQQMVELSYQAFLRRCKDLDLGICEPELKIKAPGPMESVVVVPKTGSMKDDDEPLSAMEVARADEQVVALETDCGFGLPVSVWIHPRKDEVQYEMPTDFERRGSVTSFNTAFKEILPQWTSDAMRLNRTAMDVQFQTPRVSDATTMPRFSDATMPRFSDASKPRFSVASRPSWPQGPRMSRPSMPQRQANQTQTGIALMPENATPCNRLPGVIVRYFTFVVALLWIAAAVVHLVHCIISRGTGAPTLDTEQLLTLWPEPAVHFDVTSLNCNDSILVVGNQFTLFATHHTSEAPIGPFTEVSDTSATQWGWATVFCGTSGCNKVTPISNGKGWEVAPLMTQLESNDAVSVLPTPATWQRLTMSRVACAPAPCEAASLAGWDGTQVVIAAARRSSTVDDWQIRSRFAVHSGHTRCAGKRVSCGAGTSANYSNVQALQLGADGKSLAVLLGGGILDSWDIAAGGLLGRWHLEGHPTAMCHNGQHIFLARQSEEGPVLERAQLPSLFTSDGCSQSPDASNLEVVA